jgi:hypothetical protein
MKILEELAAQAHLSWAGWMCYLFEKSRRNSDGSVTIPASLVKRWTRQMETPYEGLSEAEKQSDRNAVRPYLDVFQKFIDETKRGLG